jgi:hypothetical protein
MKLTHPLLLNAEPQDKSHKLRDREAMRFLPRYVKGSPLGTMPVRDRRHSRQIHC